MCFDWTFGSIGAAVDRKGEQALKNALVVTRNRVKAWVLVEIMNYKVYLKRTSVETGPFGLIYYRTQWVLRSPHGES